MPLVVLNAGRRITVACAPNDALSDVAARAAVALRLSPDTTYELDFQHKKLNHAVPVSSLNIPPNAVLGIGVRRARGPAKTLRVGLKVGGKRVTGSVTSDTSLLSMVQNLAEANGLDPELARGQQLEVMRRVFAPDQLASLCLADVGLTTGSAMFTLSPAPGLTEAGAAEAEMEDCRRQLETLETPRDEAKETAAPAPSPAATPASIPAPIPAPASRPAAAPAPIPAESEPDSMDVDPSPERALAASSVMPMVAHPDRDPTIPEATPPPPPLPSVDSCRASLNLLRDSHFDADARSSLRILVKLVRNAALHPDRRRVKRSNATLRAEVFSRRGAESFLCALGFVAEGPDALILPSPNPHEALLAQGYALLAAEARTLDLEAPPLRMPGPAAPAPVFNPFQSMSTSLAPRPRGTGAEVSVTARRLADLAAKRESIVQDVMEDREVRVFAPANPGAPAMAPAAEAKGAEAVEDDRADAAVLMAALGKQVGGRRAEDAPLRTRALRDLDRLSKKKVYAHALLRLALPDGATVQAKFAPRETIGDVLAFLQERVEGLAPGGSPVLSDPPRRGLPAEKTLEELGLVPAARLVVGPATVHLSDAAWAGATQGVPRDRVEAYPEGVRLGGGARPIRAEAKREGAGESKSAASRKVSAGSKPKWMKIG